MAKKEWVGEKEGERERNWEGYKGGVWRERWEREVGRGERE